MPRFPFLAMTPRARKDPLGHVTLNRLSANIQAVDALARVEHLTGGIHNALEVPRTLGKFVYAAGYTASMFNSNYVSLTNPAVGEIDVTLKGAGAFTYPGMVSLVNISTTDAKPYRASVELISSTSLKIRISKLTSALGAGNAWATVDVSCDLSVCAPPFSGVVTGLSDVADWQRRDYLHEAGGAGYDWLVQNQGRQRAASLLEHTSAGEHNAVEIAREWAYCPYAAGAYSIAAGDSTSVLKSAVGIVDVTLSATYAATTKMAAFGTVQGATADELYIINLVPNTTAKMRAYIYKYDFVNNWWVAADQGFTLWVYGAP